MSKSKIRIIAGLGAEKNAEFELAETASTKTVARIVESNRTGDHTAFYVNMAPKGSDKIKADPRDGYFFEPIIPLDMRFIIVISGESRSGKSTMASMFAEQWREVYRNRDIYFISVKNKENDQNFSQIPMKTVEDLDKFDINQYRDCLFIIDDSDFGKSKKKVMEMLNIIATVGAENNVNLVFVTHFNSRLNESLVYREFTVYITFLNNLDNNRMLTNNMNMSRDRIEELKALKESFYLFNRNYRYILTTSLLFKFDGQAHGSV